jgi:hypothetical protein
VSIECEEERLLLADLIYFDGRIQKMKPVAHIKPSPDVPGHGTQLPLPKLGLTDRPTPLLSLSLSIEERRLGDEVEYSFECEY